MQLLPDASTPALPLVGSALHYLCALDPPLAWLPPILSLAPLRAALLRCDRSYIGHGFPADSLPSTLQSASAGRSLAAESIDLSLSIGRSVGAAPVETLARIAWCDLDAVAADTTPAAEEAAHAVAGARLMLGAHGFHPVLHRDCIGWEGR